MFRIAPTPAPYVPPAGQAGARRGFTLVELLTVIAIIGVLAAVLIPTVQAAKQQARKSKSVSNLHSIGAAFAEYALANKDLLPAPEHGPGSIGSIPGSQNPTGGTWLEELIPYTEGVYSPSSPGAAVTVAYWPEVLSDPQFVALTPISLSNPDVRGYGMMIFPYRPDSKNPLQSQSFLSERQSLTLIPDHANNVLVALSNAVIIEPDDQGKFKKAGDVYVDGDAERYSGDGLYLMVDGSVQQLSPDAAAKVMATPTR